MIRSKLYRSVRLGLIAGLACVAATTTYSAEDHSGYFDDPLNSGPEVTKACLGCHEDAATQVMGTTHWTWSAEQTIDGKDVDRGKKNAINNFCISVNGNWPRCTSCHAGYGWKDASFDFADSSKVDCLVCHDTTGMYEKSPAGAGMPDPTVDLLHVARNVGVPSRDNCGACHFFGGGGDAVKHGDLDSTISAPSRDVDVHMSAEGSGFQCQECHTTESHGIRGSAMVVSPANQNPIGCTNCHEEKPHGESLVNGHMARVSCQTCHIPTFAKQLPTKTSWDWSTAGKDGEKKKDQYRKPTFMKKKGNFTWGKNIVPTYAWYDGTGGAYLPGDPIDTDGMTELSYPLGSKEDPNSKIHPFKIHAGTQPYDPQNGYLVTPHLFGKGGFWKTFDWESAIKTGMEITGLDYSGELGFTDTIMYWPINHMVSPKEQALGCLDCHGDNGRMDWKGLGYSGDPLAKKLTRAE